MKAEDEDMMGKIFKGIESTYDGAKNYVGDKLGIEREEEISESEMTEE